MNIGNNVVRYLPNELLQVVLLSYYGKIQKFIQTLHKRDQHECKTETFDHIIFWNII